MVHTAGRTDQSQWSINNFFICDCTTKSLADFSKKFLLNIVFFHGSKLNISYETNHLPCAMPAK